MNNLHANQIFIINNNILILKKLQICKRFPGNLVSITLIMLKIFHLSLLLTNLPAPMAQKS